MNRSLDGGAKARSHVDPIGAQAQSRHETAAVAEATRSNHRNLHLVGGCGNQNETRNVILARMSGTFEAVDRNCSDTHALRGQRVAHRRAFMDHDDAVLLEMRNVLLWVVPGGLDDLDAAVDDRLSLDTAAASSARPTHIMPP
jgi:hypothetical protein